MAVDSVNTLYRDFLEPMEGARVPSLVEVRRRYEDVLKEVRNGNAGYGGSLRSSYGPEATTAP